MGLGVLLLGCLLIAAEGPVAALWEADAAAATYAAKDPAGAEYQRWITAYHAAPEELPRYEQALRLLLPSVSDRGTICRPHRVSPTLWRVDAREVSRNAKRFVEAWYGLAEKDPYRTYKTTHLRHGELLRADYFIAQVSRNPAYAEFLGLPKTLDETLMLFRIDAKGNEILELDRQAAVLRSRVAISKPRQVVRQNALAGAWWYTRDVLQVDKDRDPLEQVEKIKADGGEGIGSLPNGLHWYVIFDGNGKLVDDADPKLVVNFAATGLDRQIHNGPDSCLSCHGAGYIPPRDAIGPLARHGSLVLAATDKDLALRLESLYLRGLTKQTKADNERYAESVKEATGADEPGEPAATLLALVSRYREGAVTSDIAKRELGVDDAGWRQLLLVAQAQAATKDNPPKLPGALAALAAGEEISRQSWEQAWLAAVYARYADQEKRGAVK